MCKCPCYCSPCQQQHPRTASRAGCPSGYLNEGFWGCQSLLCTAALPLRAPVWDWVRGLILPLAIHGGLFPCSAHPQGEMSPSCTRLIVAQIICDHCWKVLFMGEEQTASPPQCRHFYSQLKPQETWTRIQAVGGGKRNSFQELIQKKKKACNVCSFRTRRRTNCHASFVFHYSLHGGGDRAGGRLTDRQTDRLTSAMCGRDPGSVPTARLGCPGGEGCSQPRLCKPRWRSWKAFSELEQQNLSWLRLHPQLQALLGGKPAPC